MPELQPDQAAFLRDFLLEDLRKESATTKRVIEAIPADNHTHRPDAVSKTALELAWHIAAVERSFLSAVATGSFDLTPFPKPEITGTPAGLASWYADMFAQESAAIAQVPGDRLTQIIDFRGKFQLPAVHYLQFILGHTIHHRGQLSVYLRPAGGKVPAIYGESHDSAQAKSA